MNLPPSRPSAHPMSAEDMQKLITTEACALLTCPETT